MDGTGEEGAADVRDVPALTRVLPFFRWWWVIEDGNGWNWFDVRFLGHAKFRLWPFWGLFIYFMLIGLAIVREWIVLWGPRWFRIELTGALWGLAVVNYLVCHVLGPGAAPWTWALTGRQEAFGWRELRDGVAVRPEQVLWARARPRPRRSVISRSLGLLALRADHDCDWVGGWIGIRNHAWFVRVLLYIPAFGLASGVGMWKGSRAGLLSWWLSAPILILHCFLAALCLTQLWNQVWLISNNVTFLERLKGARLPGPFDRGWLANWEEVMGTRELWPLWLLPVPCPGRARGFEWGVVDPQNAGADSSGDG